MTTPDHATPRWGRLGNRITLIAGLAIAFALATMVGLIAFQSYQSANAHGYALAEEQAEHFADQVASALDLGFVTPRVLASAALGLREAGTTDRAAFNRIMLKTLDSTPQAVGLWMVWEPNAFDGLDDAYRLDWPRHDPSGRYIPYVTRGKDGKAALDKTNDSAEVARFPEWRDRLEQYQPAYERPGWGDFYFVPKQRGRDSITEPFFYEVQGREVLESSLAVLIKHPETGRMLGVAAMDLSLEDLQNKYGALRPYETGHVRLVSEGGLNVVHPDLAQVGKAVDKADPLASHLARIAAGEPFSYSDAEFTVFFHPIKVAGTGQFWSAGVSVPTEAIVAGAVRARNLSILIGVIALALVLALLHVLVRALTRPLDHLAHSMEQLASGKGDLTARLTIANHDEIGRTATAFNAFIDSLCEMVREVRSQSLAVSQAASGLADSAREVEAASERQSDAAADTAAGVQQVTVSVHHIADTANHAAEIARVAGQSTEQSVTDVVRVSQEIRRMTDNMHALSGRMKDLGERSREVTSIVSVIKDIADQTNLLALNAAIEAARAGEQGRGFAVVADEVRNLAARTAEATVDIDRIVGAIGTETANAVADVDLSTKLVDVSVDMAAHASASMHQIKSNSDDVVANVADIASATREQSVAATEIAQNVEKISNMAQANAQVAQGMRDAVEQLKTLAVKLEQLVGHFKL
ncbi:MAG: methyl-accepting chemotaxis protein [Pseudomonadota bacterium]